MISTICAVFLFVLWSPLQIHCILRFNLQDKNVSYTLDNLLLPTKYNKKVRPEIGGKKLQLALLKNVYITSRINK